MNFAELDALEITQLQSLAFAKAKNDGDWRFFYDLFRHTPAATDMEDTDTDLSEIGVVIEDMVGMWREATKGDWGSSEPMARAKFIDYLQDADTQEDSDGEEPRLGPKLWTSVQLLGRILNLACR